MKSINLYKKHTNNTSGVDELLVTIYNHITKHLKNLSESNEETSQILLGKISDFLASLFYSINRVETKNKDWESFSNFYKDAYAIVQHAQKTSDYTRIPSLIQGFQNLKLIIEKNLK